MYVERRSLSGSNSTWLLANLGSRRWHFFSTRLVRLSELPQLNKMINLDAGLAPRRTPRSSR